MESKRARMTPSEVSLFCQQVELLLQAGIPLYETQTPIIPILTYDDMRTFQICRTLFDAGVYVNPVISPAVPQGQAMIRTSYMATHTPAVLDEAVGIMKEVFATL